MSKDRSAFEDLSDEELVRVVQAGKEAEEGREAATELLGRYSRVVYLWSYWYVKDHDRALDMSQDVLLRAWQKLESFGGRSRFSTWIFSITRNRCLNEVRRVNILADEELKTDRVPDRDPDPAQRMEDHESEDRLYEMIRSTLDPLEQKAIWLRCFERMPMDEITGLLGIEDASGARGVLQRARRKLRAALKES